MTQKDILLIPEKYDVETEQLAHAWQDQEGEVRRIGKFWIKPDVGDADISIYGHDSFCLVLAQVLELEMLMVQDEMIVDIQVDFLKRNIQVITSENLSTLAFPIFIKPATPKLFKARVFNSLEQFHKTVGAWEKEEKLIASEVIAVEAELRSFILDKQIMDAAFYEGKGDLKAANSFIESFLNTTTLALPITFVLDVGYNQRDGWFIIELNSSWGAGLNGCEAAKVLPCIAAACNPG